MDGNKKRIFPVHFAPGKKLFHIVVKLSDAPGSYSSVLDLLSKKVNLIGTSTYSHSDGTAMFSGFAEALSPSLTAADLGRLIKESRAAMDVKVSEGNDGLLVDTFHTGFVVDSDEYILMRREGLVRVFDRVSRMLGSGGDSLLFEEGLAMGLRNAEIMANNIGAERVKVQTGVLNRFLAAQGWGELSATEEPGHGGFVINVTDCFECSTSSPSRKGCNFMRGYLVGGATATFGQGFESEEVKCVLKGDNACEFRLSAKK